MLKKLSKVILFACVGALLVSLRQDSETQHASAPPIDKVSIQQDESFEYNFTLKDLSDRKFPFEEFKGKVVFLNLWATWCGPCRSEMPTIESLYQDYKDRDDIVFVMLSIDRDRDKSKVVSYIDKESYSFPVYMPSGFLARQLQVPGIPTTFVVSKDGKIVMKHAGATDYDNKRFRKFIDEEITKVVSN